MDTPRETSLYRQLAKDYTPKQAEMRICKHMEELERRIRELEIKIPSAEELKHNEPPADSSAFEGFKLPASAWDDLPNLKSAKPAGRPRKTAPEPSASEN